MATTTPNFGWPVPTSTDLVKDGATAIEALGDSIDASLLDLKGGTSGQVLAKNSNTDMDFVWVTDAAGDITGVTAGTGISGGGTSGTVTVTNSMATAIDAKGDLVAGTGADTFARLAVGTNNQVLVADSAEATGLKWATPTSASGLTLVKQQTIGSAVSSVTVTSAFSATYDNYLITVAGGAGSGNNNLRLTLGSTTTGYYWSGVYMGWNSTVNGFGSSNGAYFTVGYGSANAESAYCNIQSPNLAKRTVFSASMIQPDTGGVQANYNGFLNDNTQYTAFTLTLDTGTVTGGEIRVYGYQNS
tara:strand:- start:167 stop:1072 length:906 start_codon:yes stop_codon:yes gene_type:complete